MSDFRRSRLSQLQVWLYRKQQALQRWLRPRWLTRAWSSLRRNMFAARHRALRWLMPRWLQSASKSVRHRLRRAEARVAETGHQLRQSVAGSAVGSSAKRLSRLGNILEFRLFVVIVEGTRWLGELLKAAVPVPVRRLVAFLAFGLWQLLAVSFVFVGQWFRTRQYLHLVGGIPAFLLALPLAYCMVRMPFYGNAAKAKHYRQAAQEALLARDFQTADLYYRKLQQLGAVNELVEFQSAYNAYESGDRVDALQKMKKLAPEGAPGFVPAHVWLARWYLKGESGLADEPARALADRHLKWALQREPGHTEARALRAYQLQRSGRWDEAQRDLEAVVKRVPEQGLSLARLYASQGHWDEALHQAEKVLSLYQQKQQDGKKLDVGDHLIWSAAHRFLGQAEMAEQVLEQGLQLYPEDESLKDQLYALCLLQTRRDGADPWADILRRLTRACQLRPDEEEPLIRLGDLCWQSGLVGQQAQATIAQLAESQHPPFRLRAVMGSAAYQHGDWKQARWQLQKACEQDPGDAQSLNNLAFLLSTYTPADHGRALQLINAALQVQPNEPKYRETRGQILIRLERYEEAVADLEYALNGLGDLPQIHAALATAYEKIGQAEVARMHRQRAGGA